jgi:elongation factor Ts
MLRFSRAILSNCSRRTYSSQGSPTVQLVRKLREATDAPLLKARQALAESNNNYDGALKWLERDLIASGAAKAFKIKDRTASEGVISLSVVKGGFEVPGVRSAMVELNCETDFVAKTDQFARMASDIAFTVAQLAKTQDVGLSHIQPEELLGLQLHSAEQKQVRLNASTVIFFPDTPLSHKKRRLRRLSWI